MLYGESERGLEEQSFRAATVQSDNKYAAKAESFAEQLETFSLLYIARNSFFR